MKNLLEHIMEQVKKLSLGIITSLLSVYASIAYAETREYNNLKDFDQITIDGNYVLTFTQSNTYHVSISSEKNVSQVQAEVNEGNLHIQQNKKFSFGDGILKITISAPSLNQSDLSGNYKASFIFNSVKNFLLNAHGEGEANLSGKIGALTLNTQGQATINAKNACANYINLQSAGVLKAELCATPHAVFDRVNFGPADITIYGNPEMGKALGLGFVNLQVKQDTL